MGTSLLQIRIWLSQAVSKECGLHFYAERPGLPGRGARLITGLFQANSYRYGESSLKHLTSICAQAVYVTAQIVI